ncbi:MAG: GWxTD domain-containing protein [Bacteroidetes bacterium]|nr:GWxTD domain-containing protein [Bacteroidota bacterium]
MKKITTIIITFILTILFSSLSASNFQAYLFYSTFYSTQDGPFIETYISVVGKSVIFIKNENGKFQGSVEITMMFKQADVIKDFKKYELLSPEIDDTSDISFNFIDQQRFSLPNGDYEFDMLIADKNRDILPFVITKIITIAYPDNKVNISGIELIESFSNTSTPNILSKSGFDLIPFVSNYFPSELNKLTFYAEIYNSEKILGKEEKFLINYHIESFETGMILTNFAQYKKEITKPVNVLFSEFNISNLPTGNYNLVIEVRDKNNNLLASNELFFQRNNPNVQLSLNDIASVDISNSFVIKYTDKDTLREYMRYLFPVSSQMEQSLASKLIKTGDLHEMQQFFLNFWLTRDNVNPEGAWTNYNEEVKKANSSFGTINRKGYDTDRGRVYLKYGPPNSIAESYYEPNAYPYEIWHYYQMKNQRNKKFVFYSRELATNDFELIHSDAIGEVQNFQWQFVIHERGNAPGSVDQNEMENHWGSKVQDYYDIPR